MKKTFLLSFLLILSISMTQAQILSEGEAIKELEKRGLDEADFRDRMLKKGFDLDNIDPTQIPMIEKAMEEVVKEMDIELKMLEKEDNEKEDQGELIKEQLESIDDKDEDEDPDKEFIKARSEISAKKIREAIEAGVPIEEAIANELGTVENDELPASNIYGQHIFRNKSISVYTPAEDIRPPETYVLGPGDEISVVIWGKSQENASFTISKEGFIKPDKMPRINLKGLTYSKARSLLESRYSQYFNFRPENFEVTIDYSRTITINILGEAFESGSYNLPATNTAFNALVAAGGPTDIGSVRNIKLIHPGGSSKVVDIYKMMLDPTVVKDFFLENNDYLFIPVAQKLISIEGEINRPFKYELIEGEGLEKLINYAGGLTGNAYMKNIQIQRIENDEEVIIDVDYRASSITNRNIVLLNGDRVIVQKIPKEVEKFVKIEGAVKYPGKFEFREGMKLKELIQKSILEKGARRDLAFIQRKNLDNSIKWIKISVADDFVNVELKAEDKVLIYKESNFVDEQNFIVEGAVRDARILPYDNDEELRVSDAIILAGGLIPDATDFGYIFRRDPETRSLQEYVRLDLADILANPESSSNINIRPFDSLVVYNYRSYIDDSFINVKGAVREEATFVYDPTLSLKDAITLAGGLRLEASRSRVEISRVEIDQDNNVQTSVLIHEIDESSIDKDGSEIKLRPFDIINIRTAPEFELQRNVTLKGEVKYSGSYSIIGDNEKISDLIKRAGGLTKEAFPAGATLYRIEDGVGYVVMALDEVMENSNSKHNYIIKEGDVIEIPKQKDFVSIRGASKAKEIFPDKILRTGQINVPFYKGKNAKWYVDNFAAGIGENGRRRLITVEHPNGRLEKTNEYLLFKSYPEVQKGSIITIGAIEEKEIEKQKEQEDINWGKIFADAITQATSILALILLIENTN